MSSPHKNFSQNYESPYARHLPQYPSQNESYTPNEFSGKSRMQSSTPHKQNKNFNLHGNNTNYSSNFNNNRRRGNGGNRYFNANKGPGSGGNISGGGNGGGASGYHNQNNYQNNMQPNYNQQPHRYSNSGNRHQPYYGHKYNKSDNSRSDYYHPSMLVDPWKDLIARHNAIKNSKIDAASTTNPEDPADELPKDEDSSSSASSSPSPTHDEEEATTVPTIPPVESSTSPNISL